MGSISFRNSALRGAAALSVTQSNATRTLEFTAAKLVFAIGRRSPVARRIGSGYDLVAAGGATEFHLVII